MPRKAELESNISKPCAVAVDFGCRHRRWGEGDAERQFYPVFGFELIKRVLAVAAGRLEATRMRFLDIYRS